MQEEHECSRCGCTSKDVKPDPAIDEVYFCSACWEERVKVTAMHEYGYDNDIMEE